VTTVGQAGSCSVADPDGGGGSDPDGGGAGPFSGTTVDDDDGVATVGYGNKCSDGSGSVGGGGLVFGSGDM